MNYNNIIGYFFLLLAGTSFDYGAEINKEELKHLKEELRITRKEALLIRKEVALARAEAVRMKEAAAREKYAADTARIQTAPMKGQIKGH